MVLTTLPLSANPTQRSGRKATLAAAISLTALAILLISRQNFLDLDVYFQMALIRAAFYLHHWPVQDVFAFTSKPGPSVNHEWGMGAILYGATRLGGGTGLIVLKYVLIVLLFTIGLSIAHRRGAGWPALCVLFPGPVWLLAWGFSTIRGGLLSLVFLGILLLFLEADRRGNRRWLWFWIPLYITWVNIHPAFLIGVGAVVLYGAENVLRHRRMPWHLLGLVVAMLALMLINPYGIRYPGAIWYNLAVMPKLGIAGWPPIWQFPSWPYRMIFFASVLVGVYTVLRTGLRNCDGVLLLAVFALAATLHVRHGYLYAFAWLCYAPAWFSLAPLGVAISNVWTRHPNWVALAWLVFLAAMVPSLKDAKPFSLFLPVVPDPAPNADNSLLYPAGVVDYLKQQDFHGNVMTHYNDGSYVMWKMWPAVKVGMDSRADIAYSDDRVREITAMYDGCPGWQTTLNRFPSDLLLINRAFALVHCMTQQSPWTKVYDDDAFELWQRPGLDLPKVDRRGQILHADFP